MYSTIPQQINRQKTCSPAYQEDKLKNGYGTSKYVVNKYLVDKLYAIDQQELSKDPPLINRQARKKPSVIFFIASRQTVPILPMDVIVTRLGKNTPSLPNIWFLKSPVMFVPDHPVLHDVYCRFPPPSADSPNNRAPLI
jgi:hypothetical protein